MTANRRRSAPPSTRTARVRGATASWLGPAIVAALALALRLYRIDAQSLWFDEGWSVHLAQEPLAEALRQIASEGHTHPPGYYLLLMAWVRAFGDGVAGVRALSALIGAATVYLVYRAGRALFDHPTGMLAAALLALSPAHWVYSQEARMYALLAAAFAGLLPLVHRYARARGGWGWRDWAALVALEILACYTHLFATLFLAGLAAWLIVMLLADARADAAAARRNRRALLPWVASQAVVGLAFLPWLGPALARAETHSALGAMAPHAGQFVLDTWAFLMGGHIALAGREPLFAAAAQASLALAGAVVAWLVVARRDRRGAALYLVVQAAIPATLLFLLMQARPGYHPRYALVSLVPLTVVVAAGATALLRRGGWWVGLVVIAVLAWFGATGLAAHALVTDRTYDRDDARGVAAHLQESLPTGGATLMDVDDWALRYYLTRMGREALYVDGGRDADAVAAECGSALEGRPAAALVTWYAGETDYRELLPYLLERSGAGTGTEHVGGYTVRLYALRGRAGDPLVLEPEADFGPLRLVRAAVDATAPADEGVPVELVWRADETLDANYKMSLRLLDAGGHDVARVDRLLQAADGTPTHDWPAHREAAAYAVLDPPPGTPPGRYALEVGVYTENDPEGLDLLDAAGNPAGKAYALPEVALSPAAAPLCGPVDWASLGLEPLDPPHPMAPGLEVLAYTPPTGQVDTGLSLEVRIAWHCVSPDLPDDAPALRLVRNGVVVAEHASEPAYGAHPMSRWRPGEVVLEWRELVVPVDLPEGPAEMQLVVAGGTPLRLGEVRIDAVPHTFAAPIPAVATAMSLGGFAELVGYDPPPAEVHPPEQTALTLYWHARGAADAEYVVFTHLLGEDGRLVAQHDAPPAGGARPTTGWVSGEYIVDAHLLEWLAPDYRGALTVEVGLYDPATGERLLASDGDSRLLLPAAIMAP